MSCGNHCARVSGRRLHRSNAQNVREHQKDKSNNPLRKGPSVYWDREMRLTESALQYDHAAKELKKKPKAQAYYGT